jgi:methylated-DNA-[protein]-cysteine S-methyltransferase
VLLPPQAAALPQGAIHAPADPILCAAVRFLNAYFAGEEGCFALPPALPLTAFYHRILRATGAIPFGETVSYGALAAQVGKPAAARAVGQALRANPLPLLIPCHRVVAASGGLIGYSAGEGLSTKAWLLAFEARLAGT